jgi:uncharacterized Fe-S cluster-containing radical SAM superfamily protein
MKNLNESAPNHENKDYRGYLRPGFRPFDPVRLANKIEALVCEGNKRRYSRFGSTINYQTAIATGYAVGCCLRCIYCWASKSRDCLMESYSFYSPQEAFERLADIAQQKKLNQLRISDGESTIGKTHLLELLELMERSKFKRFIVETNGIILGNDRDYIKSLSRFNKIFVRVSLKAGTAADFTHKTGAIQEAFELPFLAIRYLKAAGIPLWVSAMSADPRFMSPLERISLIGKLAEIDASLALNLEEEMVVLYPETRQRLEAIGWEFRGRQLHKLQKIPWLRQILQVSYCPVSKLSNTRISKIYTKKAIRELYHGI